MMEDLRISTGGVWILEIMKLNTYKEIEDYIKEQMKIEAVGWTILLSFDPDLLTDKESARVFKESIGWPYRMKNKIVNNRKFPYKEYVKANGGNQKDILPFYIKAIFEYRFQDMRNLSRHVTKFREDDKKFPSIAYDEKLNMVMIDLPINQGGGCVYQPEKLSKFVSNMSQSQIVYLEDQQRKKQDEEMKLSPMFYVILEKFQKSMREEFEGADGSYYMKNKEVINDLKAGFDYHKKDEDEINEGTEEELIKNELNIKSKIWSKLKVKKPIFEEDIDDQMELLTQVDQSDNITEKNRRLKNEIIEGLILKKQPNLISIWRNNEVFKHEVKIPNISEGMTYTGYKSDYVEFNKFYKTLRMVLLRDSDTHAIVNGLIDKIKPEVNLDFNKGISVDGLAYLSSLSIYSKLENHKFYKPGYVEDYVRKTKKFLYYEEDLKENADDLRKFTTKVIEILQKGYLK